MPGQRRFFRHFELAYIVAFIGLGLVGLFWEVFVFGYVQVPADILFTDPVMREAAPPGFTRPQNTLLADHIYQFYVWHDLAAKSMQSDGKIPLWNPDFLAGQPLVANAQSALFYPPNLLLFWLTPARVATVCVFFNILVAGLFTFLFCRALKISLPGATLAAVAFAFSGAVMVGPGHPYANSLVWLPFCLWSVEKLLTDGRAYFWALVTAIGMGLSVLGGHPETTVHVWLVVSLYWAARLVFAKLPFKAKVQLSLAYLMAAMVGVLLGAVQWLPFADFMSNSGLVSRSPVAAQVGQSIFYSRDWIAHASTLVTLLYPNFFGNPEQLTYFWPFPTYQNYLEQSMYFGLIPVALAAGVSLTARKKQLPLLILVVLAILSLAIAFRLPGFEALNYLPILNRINNTRLKWIFSFLGATLAGFGLDGFSAYVVSRGKQSRIVFLVSAVTIFTTIAIFVGLTGLRLVVAAKHLSVGLAWQLLLAVFEPSQTKTMISLAAALAAVGCYLAVRLNIRWLRACEWAVVLITLVELVVVARGYNTTLPPAQITPEVSLTRELEKDTSLYRVMAIPPTFWPNYAAVYGIQSVGGYDLPVYQWSMAINAAQGGKDYRQVWSPEWPLVDWMNIKYIISAGVQTLPKLKLVFSGAGYQVYQNENALPRAYMVYQPQVVTDTQMALQKLVSGSFDFKNVVLLETNLPANQEAMLAKTRLVAPTQQVDVVAYKDDRVVLDVTTSTPGMLVMSDGYAPGWKAWVDGQADRLYRANYAYRAVFVPAGKHRVEFTYEPWSFTWGSRLSILGLLVLAVGISLTLKVRARAE
jgi:hypothetical protein